MWHHTGTRINVCRDGIFPKAQTADMGQHSLLLSWNSMCKISLWWQQGSTKGHGSQLPPASLVVSQFTFTPWCMFPINWALLKEWPSSFNTHLEQHVVLFLGYKITNRIHYWQWKLQSLFPPFTSTHWSEVPGDKGIAFNFWKPQKFNGYDEWFTSWALSWSMLNLEKKDKVVSDAVLILKATLPVYNFLNSLCWNTKESNNEKKRKPHTHQLN